MNETSIKPIGSMQTAKVGLRVLALSPDRMEHFRAREHATGDIEKSTRAMEAEQAQVKHIPNISIHFNVEEETNRLVVIVSELESGRIIRTIPASEFEKLRVGELLKLTA